MIKDVDKHFEGGNGPIAVFANGFAVFCEVRVVMETKV